MFKERPTFLRYIVTYEVKYLLGYVYMFYFQWNVIRITFKNFGDYDVSFKSTNITKVSLFIHWLYAPH